MQEELANALARREEILAHLTELPNIPEESGISKALAGKLKEGYERDLKAVDQEIAALRKRCQNEISILGVAAKAYSARIDELKAKASGGSLSPTVFQRRVAKLVPKKEQAEQKKAAFEKMFAAESLRDLAGIVLSTEKSGWFGRIGLFDIGLRAAGVAVAALMLAAVFMPVVSAPDGLVKVSLIRAGGAAFSLGNVTGMLLWLVPIGLATVVGLTSAIARRKTRGSVMLALGTIVAGLAIVAMACLAFVPILESSSLGETVNALAHPGTGMFCMAVSIIGIYALGAVNLWETTGGKSRVVLSGLLLIAVGMVTSAYCVLGVNAEPELILAGSDPARPGSAMRVTVTNAGNLSMKLREEFSGNAGRNEFVLKIQSQGPDGNWRDVRSEIWLDEPGFDDMVAGHGGSRDIEVAPEFPDQSASAVFRAVLVNRDGHVVTSAPTVVTRYYGSTLTTRAASGTVASSEDPFLTIALGKVGNLEAVSGTVPEDGFVRAVENVRAAISRVEDEADNESLHKRVDTLILESKNRQAGPVYDQAYEFYQQRFFDQASELCRQVIDICGQMPQPEVLQQDPDVMVRAETLLAYIEMRQDPAKRYELRGIIARDTTSAAMLFDRMGGKSVTVSEKDELDEFKVERIDDEQNVVVLRKGRERFVLSRR